MTTVRLRTVVRRCWVLALPVVSLSMYGQTLHFDPVVQMRGRGLEFIRARFSSDGDGIIAWSDNNFRVFDMLNGYSRVLPAVPTLNVIDAGALSADGKRVAVIAGGRSHLQLWDLTRSEDPSLIWEGTNNASRVQPTPAGDGFLSRECNDKFECQLLVREFSDGRRRGGFSRATVELADEWQYGARGKMLLAQRKDRSGVASSVWDIHSGRELYSRRGRLAHAIAEDVPIFAGVATSGELVITDLARHGPDPISWTV